MSSTDAVTATVEVGVDPNTAFEIFTEEIGRWWRPGPINWYDANRAVDIRFEPGVGGRWLDVYDDARGDVLEIGRILVWEPGSRLVLLYRDGGHKLDGTEVEVRFERTEGGTSVTIEHRGWDKVSPEVAESARYTKRWGWASILGWYQEWALSLSRCPRLGPESTGGASAPCSILHYGDSLANQERPITFPRTWSGSAFIVRISPRCTAQPMPSSRFGGWRRSRGRCRRRSIRGRG